MQTQAKYIIVLVALTFITSLTGVSNLAAQDDKFVVVLDAGHGGHDPGRPTKNGYKEKDIALKIALQIGKELEKNPDFKIIYTRKTDVFVELHERANIANKADADLFVSVHCNAHNTQAYGTETFVLGANNSERNMAVARAENEVVFLEEDFEEHYEGFDPNSPESGIALTIEQEIYVEQSIILARKVEDNFSGKLKRKSRGIKQASLLVIRNTYMPSVLIETGFITNKNEGAYLNSKKGQTAVAKSIKDAIVSYKKELDLNVGTHILGTDSEVVEAAEEVPLLYEDVTFKVQIAASSRDLEPKSYNFNGLSNLSKEKVGELYKYYYGSTTDLNEAKQLKEEARQKGYTSSFVVGYKDGKRIDISKL